MKKLTTREIVTAEGLRVVLVGYQTAEFQKFFMSDVPAAELADQVAQQGAGEAAVDAFLDAYQQRIAQALRQRGSNQAAIDAELKRRLRIFDASFVGIVRQQHNQVPQVLGQQLQVGADGTLSYTTTGETLMVLPMPAKKEPEPAPAAPQKTPAPPKPAAKKPKTAGKPQRSPGANQLKAIVAAAALLLLMVCGAIADKQKAEPEPAEDEPTALLQSEEEDDCQCEEDENAVYIDSLLRSQPQQLRAMLSENALVYIDGEPELARDYVKTSYLQDELQDRTVVAVEYSDNLTTENPLLTAIYIN